MAVSNPSAKVVESKQEDYERPIYEVYKRFKRHKLAMVSVVAMMLMFTAVIFGPVISPFTERAQNLKMKDKPPMTSWVLDKPITANETNEIVTPVGTEVTAYFGTDELGRDLLTRLLLAGRVSLYIAFAVTILGELIGIILGVISGYFGGFADTMIMRTVDFLNTLPLLPILLVITSITKPSINKLILILVFFGWTGGARLMRGQILSLREQEFVSASKALGASNSRIMFRHLVPNALAPAIVSASLGLSGVMILEAALSFLGFGVQLPSASWGNMLNNAGTAQILENQPWRAFFPGLAIFFCSLCFNFIGDGLRDALDPRAKH